MTDLAKEVERLRMALGLAISHIDHMAAWISRVNVNGLHVTYGTANVNTGRYCFESLSEDEETIRSALAASPASLSRGEAIRFYKLPFTLHEPKGDGAAYIRDADGGAVAMLMWPGHSLEDTDAATEETCRIGRAMAAALPSPEAPANRQEAGE